MKKIFKRHANKGGVYQIINTINGKKYIGSAKTFKTRAHNHFTSLKNNKHQNRHMQASFNKHGTDAFLFEVIEVVEGDKAARTVREQFYIDQELENWEQCFNFKKKTIEKERSCHSNDPKITSKLLSEKGKAAWANPKFRAKRMKTFRSEEFRKKQSEKQKKVSQNPKYGNSAAAHRKRYSDPKEREKLSKQLKKAWARDDGARRKKVSKAAKKIYASNKEKISAARLKAKAKYYGKIVSPDGEVFEIYNAQKFIREHGFSQYFYEMLNGKCETYKGWKRL